jgi:small GTP-binding protein
MASPGHAPGGKAAPTKVVLIGASGVGKSNLLSVLHTGTFSDAFASTIGVEFIGKTFQANGGRDKIKAQIWDTAGQERFSTMMGTYFRCARGALLVYDVTSRRSFEAIERWLKKLISHADPDEEGLLSLVVCGNKSDLGEDLREVSSNEAESYARGMGAHFFETSAKQGINVQESFQRCIDDIWAKDHPQGNDIAEEESATAAQQTSPQRPTNSFVLGRRLSSSRSSHNGKSRRSQCCK